MDAIRKEEIMDVFELYRRIMNRIKLFVLYWRRIVFVKNHFKVPFFTKLRANISGGFLADQWALYELNGKKKKEYLSEFDWYRSRYINEPFDYMLNNKVITTEVLRQYIRVPELLAVDSKGFVSDLNGNPMSTDELLKIVREQRNTIIKPFAKGKGIGVHIFTYDGEGYLIDSKPADEADVRRIFEKHKDWYLSEVVSQHAYADDIYDQTVNTIRIITMKDPGTGKFKVFFAVQRVGTHATIPVDNASQGGLVCKIDLETGRLSHGRSLHNSIVYDTHPDSGIRFEDVVIPDWKELMDEILALVNHFPYLHFVAWDVIKLPDGTNCIIEANTSSGVNIIQLWGGQRHGELGDFYRHYGVIKK